MISIKQQCLMDSCWGFINYKVISSRRKRHTRMIFLNTNNLKSAFFSNSKISVNIYLQKYSTQTELLEQSLTMCTFLNDELHFY